MGQSNFQNISLATMLAVAVLALGCGDGRVSGSPDGGDRIDDGGMDGGDTRRPGGGAGVLYELICELPVVAGMLEVPIRAELEASTDLELTVDGTATMTTKLWVGLPPFLLVAAESAAPDAMVTSASFTLSVIGGTPTEIVHSLPGVPVAPRANFEGESVVTEITHDGVTSAVGVELTGFSVTLSGLPPELSSTGEWVLDESFANCPGGLTLADGEMPVEFSVNSSR